MLYCFILGMFGKVQIVREQIIKETNESPRQPTAQRKWSNNRHYRAHTHRPDQFHSFYLTLKSPCIALLYNNN